MTVSMRIWKLDLFVPAEPEGGVFGFLVKSLVVKLSACPA
jgi:hypothetical protein